MGVQFTSDVRDARVTERLDACLCAQLAPGWPSARPEVIAAEADPGCPWCGGTGFELVRESDAPGMDACCANARALLAVLGLGSELWGEVPIPVARRAVMRARARRDVHAFARPERLHHGAPRATAGGAVELRPLVAVELGQSPAELLARVEQFASFVEESAARGATLIRWA